MNLEDCIAAVSDLGADGVEILGEQMVWDFPTASESFLKRWQGWMAKYHTRPSCYDSFLDTKWYVDRPLTLQESVDMMVRDIKLAHQMGFKIMRTLVTTPPEVVEHTLPYLEKYDIRMGIEIHAPWSLKSEWVDAFMDLIAKTKTRHFGFIPDMSIFVKRPPRLQQAWFVRHGAQESVVEYVGRAFQDGVPKEKTAAAVERMGGNELDKGWAQQAYFYGPLSNDPKDLLPLMPYVFHIHAKFYEMTEDFQEWSIPYAQIIPVLMAGGFNGYLSSEYEGQRMIDDAFEVDSVEQVRRQHVMFKRLLHEV
jgi:sugar phosphate isomerase/epimerase